MNHIGTFTGKAHRVLGNVRAHIAQLQVIAGVQHSAVCIAAALNQAVLVLFSGGHEHLGAVEVLGQQGFGNFRTEVAQIDAQRIAAGFLDILQRLHHVDFALHNTDGALINILCVIRRFVSFYQGFSAVYGQGLREAVAADRHDTHFYFRHVVHGTRSSCTFPQILPGSHGRRFRIYHPVHTGSFL